jgi:hypothetical protein
MTTTDKMAEALRDCLSMDIHHRACKPWHDKARAALAAHEAEVAAEPVDDPCLVLWQAMNEAQKYGQRTDDKLIVKFLREAGYVIAPAAPAEPTIEMLKAGAAEWLKYGEREACYPLAQGFDKLTPEDAIRRSRLTHVYRAMLAAPSAPAPVALTDEQLLAEAEFTESYDASAPSFQSLLRDDAIVGDFQRRLLIVMRAAIAASKGGAA